MMTTTTYRINKTTNVSLTAEEAEVLEDLHRIEERSSKIDPSELDPCYAGPLYYLRRCGLVRDDLGSDLVFLTTAGSVVVAEIAARRAA